MKIIRNLMGLAVAMAQLTMGSATAFGANAEILDATSKVDEVLVYSTRALVTRLATVRLTAAKQRIRVATLPTSIDASSVRVTCRTAAVMRVEVETSRGRLPRQAEAEKLADAIEVVDDQLRLLRDETNLLHQELSYIRSLSLERAPTNPHQGAKVEGIFFDGWKRILRWLEGRGSSILLRVDVLAKTREELQKKRHALVVKGRDLDLGAADRPMLTIIATVGAASGRHKLTLSYLVPRVSWRPSYDLRYDHLKDRVEATYYATLRQQSGEDWSNAKLRFSTARPTLEVSIPELSTWTLGRKRDFSPKPRPRYEPQLRPWRARAIRRPPNYGVQRLRRLIGQSGPSGRGYGKSKRDRGRYDRRRSRRYPKRAPMARERMKSRPAHTKPSSISPSVMAEADSDAEADEVMPMAPPPAQRAPARSSRRRVAFGASRISGSLNRPSGHRVAWTQQGYRPPYMPSDSPAASAKGYLFTLFAPGRHEVPSSHKSRRIPVLRTSFAVKPVHRLVPGRSKSAYVLAEFKNNTGRPILRGHANLFTGSMFSGRSFINTALPGHKLSLPLGVDDSVKVVRHLSQKTVIKGAIFRDDVTEYTVNIEIANHRRRAISVDLRDQIPIKMGKKIEIKKAHYFTDGRKQKAVKAMMHRKPGWTAADDQGRVVWIGTVRPGKVRKLSFSFRIVRPKDWMLRQHGG